MIELEYNKDICPKDNRFVNLKVCHYCRHNVNQSKIQVCGHPNARRGLTEFRGHDYKSSDYQSIYGIAFDGFDY
jgi:hypothetical protein